MLTNGRRRTAKAYAPVQDWQRDVTQAFNDMLERGRLETLKDGSPSLARALGLPVTPLSVARNEPQTAFDLCDLVAALPWWHRFVVCFALLRGDASVARVAAFGGFVVREINDGW
jgi:hypothetical protein